MRDYIYLRLYLCVTVYETKKQYRIKGYVKATKYFLKMLSVR